MLPIPYYQNLLFSVIEGSRVKGKHTTRRGVERGSGSKTRASGSQGEERGIRKRGWRGHEGGWCHCLRVDVSAAVVVAAVAAVAEYLGGQAGSEVLFGVRQNYQEKF